MKNYATKWILQRITALILIPLTFWFIYQCVLISNYEYDEIRAFFSSKLNSAIYFVLITVMLYHSKLGCETIIEDYVTSHKLKKITKLSISAIIYLFMFITITSLIFIINS